MALCAECCGWQLYPAVSWLCLKLILLLLLNNILPSENEVHLWFVAAAFVANLLLENIVAERYNELRIGGKARGLLRTALLDVSSQLQLKEQEQFSGGEVMNIMGAGVETVISMVWANFFNLVQVWTQSEGRSERHNERRSEGRSETVRGTK